MVSPKETFVHYRELFEYIGRKIGRPVEMIQRKTYLEINQLLAGVKSTSPLSAPGRTPAARKNMDFRPWPFPRFRRPYLPVLSDRKPGKTLSTPARPAGRVFALRTRTRTPVDWRPPIGCNRWGKARKFFLESPVHLQP